MTSIAYHCLQDRGTRARHCVWQLATQNESSSSTAVQQLECTASKHAEACNNWVEGSNNRCRNSVPKGRPCRALTCCKQVTALPWLCCSKRPAHTLLALLPSSSSLRKHKKQRTAVRRQERATRTTSKQAVPQQQPAPAFSALATSPFDLDRFIT
jgi:hypothetical protein